MKRMQVMFGKRRAMVLVTLAILILAAAAIIASSASFSDSDTTANVNNTFTGGELVLTNTGALTFQDLKLWPGGSITGSGGFSVLSDGGPSELFIQQTTDLSANAFAGVLEVTVVVSDGTTPVTYGPVAVNSAALAAGVSVGTLTDTGATAVPYTVNVTVDFPGDADAGTLADNGADNPYQNATCDPTFEFTAISQ